MARTVATLPGGSRIIAFVSLGVITKFSPAGKIHERLRESKLSWYRTWRLISLDGSTLDIADTVENGNAFGWPGSRRRSSALPKIRFVALLEKGTRVLS